MDTPSVFSNFSPAENGALLGGLAGTGLGAIYGGLGSKKNRLRSALMYGLAGGGLGAGAGAGLGSMLGTNSDVRVRGSGAGAVQAPSSLRATNVNTITTPEASSEINQVGPGQANSDAPLTAGLAQQAANKSTGLLSYKTLNDGAMGAGLSTVGTTGGLALLGALAGKRMPMLKGLFNNAAKESLMFLNPVRSYKLIKRLPAASSLSARQMNLTNDLMKAKLPPSNDPHMAADMARNNPGFMNDTHQYEALRQLNKDTQAFKLRHGELPTDTLEKGIGVANGVMNLGIGAATGIAIPQFFPEKESSHNNVKLSYRTFGVSNLLETVIKNAFIKQNRLQQHRLN